MTLGYYYTNNVFSALNQIQNISDEKEKQEIATKFIEELINEYSKDYNFLIERFLEIGSDIILEYGQRPLMDTLKESIFCYVNGQYLSTVASVGIASELFCANIYTLYLQEIGLERSQIKRRIEKFSNIRQAERIDTLFAIVGIDEHVCALLRDIKKIRNKNAHPHADKEYKSDALSCLHNLIDVLNIYSNHISEQREKKSEDNEN